MDLLVVGSELVSTEAERRRMDAHDHHAVRKIFKGRLTYSSNWDHYTSVPFWDQLDMIGMNSYWKLGETRSEADDADASKQIENRWKEIQDDLLPFVQKTGKPLLFLEIGWFSQDNVAYEPWDYTK